MNNVMLDLETMGNGANAAIVAIGAVRFDRGAEPFDPFYVIVDVNSCLDVGLQIDFSTVIWWIKQGDGAKEIFKETGVPLREALSRFTRWVGKDALVWGNGAAFDNAILSNAYRRCSMKQPWDYCNDRCYRTVKGLVPEIEIVRAGVHHCALDDAKNQARHLNRIFNSWGYVGETG